MNLFNVILNDNSIQFSRHFEKMIQLIKSIVSGFVQNLESNPSLAFLVFQWKTKSQCLLIKNPLNEDDFETTTISSSADSSVSSKKKKTRKSTRSNKKSVGTAQGKTKTKWTKENDKELIELYDK